MLRALLAFLLGVPAAAFAGASGSTIEEFKFATCGRKNCVVVEAKSAFVGAIQSLNYAFDPARITITARNSRGTSKTHVAGGGYYDAYLQKIILRELDGKSDAEAIYDLIEERLFVYDLAAGQ